MSVVITPEMIRQLRDRTGAGFMDCKKALLTAEGDLERAEVEIAKAGNKKAEKIATKSATEGVVVALLSPDQHRVALVEVNCQTDFVARDHSFLAFAQKVAKAVLETAQESTALNDPALEEERKLLVGKIGENIQIRRARFLGIKEGHVGVYVHNARIAVMVHTVGGDAALAKDLAMHVAASRPEYLSIERVPTERFEKEKEIFIAQSENSGKPREIIEKMVQGRLNKYFSDLCLLEQPFVKNPDLTVAQLLKEKHATVQSYVRLEMGEGLEKQTGLSFAEEVAQITGGN